MILPLSQPARTKSVIFCNICCALSLVLWYRRCLERRMRWGNHVQCQLLVGLTRVASTLTDRTYWRAPSYGCDHRHNTTHNHNHHHQVLLLLVEHRASMKSCQPLRSPRPHSMIFLLPLISSSIVCPSPRSLRPTSSSISLRIPI